jgi:2-oxoglutarate/2-oxoacid ferredoxin oxidoreductase subunit beta
VTAESSRPALTKKDFQSDQDVRWCPGCGDYAILAAVQSIFPELGIPRERLVIVSGIGCSSRFPYYMNVYGFHGIHGRAPAIATGLKIVRPELDVWVVTGDGDGLSIGGNHFIHLLRRNVGLKVLLFNNRVYGLTKGQYSPTSEMGKKTRSSPFGTTDRPFHPLSLALGAEATFVARAVDVLQGHLRTVLRRAAAHKGSAFVEVLQTCVIFNDGAWDHVTDKATRDDHTIVLEHGQPLLFGKNQDKGIRMRGIELEVVSLGGGVTEKDLIVHDERHPNPAYAFLLSRMESTPGFPTPLGVLRAVDAPSLEAEMRRQQQEVIERKGKGDLGALLATGDTWEVS